MDPLNHYQASQCERCGAPVRSVQLLHGMKPLQPRYCAVCLNVVKAEVEAEKKEGRRYLAREEWQEMCPAEYRETDRNRLPCPPALLDRVLGWQYGPKGLQLGGPTERGKTRTMLLLLERLMVEDGKSIVMFLGNSFARRCARMFDEEDGGMKWLLEAMDADVVLIDDLGKFKLTPRVESELFGLIEHRTSWKLPIMVTQNASGAKLERMLSEDRGAPLLRRLREFCEPVAF